MSKMAKNGQDGKEWVRSAKNQQDEQRMSKMGKQ